MRLTTIQRQVAVLMVALPATLPAGCGDGGGADKAGGSNAPAIVRLAVPYNDDQPDAPLARDFAARVAKLSNRSLRVRVVFEAAGGGSADPEAQVVRMVRAGEFELGWVGARAWDRLGIKSFQALQAPFLVTSHELLSRIAGGPLAAQMLAGLDGSGFAGIALVPERMRYVMGARGPLTSPADFAGARVRVIPSRVTETLMRSLGATPVHLSSDGFDTALADDAVDAVETSLGGTPPGGSYLTGNVTLFAKMLTLFAAAGGDRLDDDQRAIIRKAGRQTAIYAAAHPPSETALVRRYCDVGHVVSASRDDAAALMRAARPVYAELERDPQTKTLIAAIRKLKATTPAASPEPPVRCGLAVSSTAGQRLSPSALNGTYHWRTTAAGARAAGGTPNSEDVGIIGKMTLRDGKWRIGEEEPERNSGTFTITTQRLVFRWLSATLTFTYTRNADGTLQLKPVAPMDPGDRTVWAGGPWRRVGPPVRDIP